LTRRDRVRTGETLDLELKLGEFVDDGTRLLVLAKLQVGID
jgi:hypothetical protein